MLCKHAAESGTLELKPAHQDSTRCAQAVARPHAEQAAPIVSSRAELSRVGSLSPFPPRLEQGRTDIAIGPLLQLAGFHDVELTDLHLWATSLGKSRRRCTCCGPSPLARSTRTYKEWTHSI